MILVVADDRHPNRSAAAVPDQVHDVRLAQVVDAAQVVQVSVKVRVWRYDVRREAHRTPEVEGFGATSAVLEIVHLFETSCLPLQRTHYHAG